MNQVNQFLRQYQLDEKYVYLLELIPLIKMIWADGRNQVSEVAILKRFTMKHLATLASRNEGVMPISVESTNLFLDRFLNQEPSQAMLTDLSKLCAHRLRNHSDLEFSRARAKDIIDFCIDIAAACAVDYPFEYNERIVEQEKAVLTELIREFGF